MNLVTRICIRNSLVSLIAHAQQWLKEEVWHMTWLFRQWREHRAATKAAKLKGFTLPTARHLAPIPAGDNPFHHDAFHMGTTLVRGWMVMHTGFDRKENPLDLTYVILVNTRTGQRIRINL